MAHTKIQDLKSKFEDGDRPTGVDFANLLDSCHNSILDTDVLITGTLTVSGATHLDDKLTVVDDTHLQKKLDVGGSLSIGGNTALRGTLTVSKGVSLSETLYVSKDSIFNQNINVKGAGAIDGTLTVSDATTITGLVTMLDSATITKNLDVTGDTITTGSLTNTSQSNLNDVNIAGALDITSLHAKENVVLDKNLNVKGETTLDSDVHIKGDLTVDGNVVLKSDVAGTINVGDSHHDSVVFSADVASNVTPDETERYNLGSDVKRWDKIYVADLDVTGTVDGRDVSADGIVLDNTANDMSVVANTSASWDTAYIKSLANEQDLAIVSAASAGWDETEAIVTGSKDAWSDTRTTVKTYSASWEESADIQAVADELAVVGAVSADWSDSRTTVNSNSATWNKTKLVEFVDVNPAGLSNNSILRYDDATSTWVASTTEDTKASGTITVLDGNNTAWDDATLILKDNDAPANTVTFTGDIDADPGTITKVNNFSYTFGYAGVVTNSHAAEVIAEAINLASSNGDLAITAEAVNDSVNLSQDKAGAGGNTDITGGLLAMQLISVSNFTGGENPDAFEHLDDTPASYGGNSGKFVKVNSSEDGLEFIEDDTRTTVNTFSASWEESADIQAVADDVANVGAVSGDWNDARTSLVATSGDWNDTRSSLMAASGDWNESQSVVNTTSADWNDTRASMMATSGDWNDTRSSLMAASGDWNETQSVVNNTSGSWNESTAVTNTTSADWNDARSSLMAASGDWNESQSVVNSTSGSWNEATAVTNTTSADWNEATAVTNTTSADWSDARSTLMGASGDWTETQLVVNTTSADWNEVKTEVNSTSAEWNSVYSHINSVSGQGIATLDLDGKLLTDQIPELSITRVHTANNPSEVELLNPATGIQVGDVIVVMSTHDNLIALVDDPSGAYDSGTKDYTGYAKLAMPDGLVQTVNGKPGPSVVLNPDDMLDDSTAHKFVSQEQIDDWSDSRSTLLATSGDWNDTRTALQAASGDWTETQTVVNETSGAWNEVKTEVNSTSADWNDTRTTLQASSGDWYDTRSSVMNTSGNWDSVYSFVNSDSATNNTQYNEDTYVNVTGDKMTGNLHLDGAELIVGGNITMAGDLIHENDTGTRISFNDDIINLEANGQEFITIDGTSPTPDAVIINDPASTAIHFQVKTPDDDCAFVIDGESGTVNIGQCISDNTGSLLEVDGTAKFVNAITQEQLSVIGEIVSGVDATPLHDIFSTSTDIEGDLTVRGSVSSRDELIVNHTASVSGDLILKGDIDGLENTKINGPVETPDGLTSSTYKTTAPDGSIKEGVTQDVNIGGHVLHIVNGLIVEVTDE